MKKVLLVCSLALTGILGATIVSCGNNEQTDNPGGNTPTGEFDTSKSITLYSREAGSGTRECFFEGIGYGVLKKKINGNQELKFNQLVVMVILWQKLVAMIMLLAIVH